jgi:hypothetical protein
MNKPKQAQTKIYDASKEEIFHRLELLPQDYLDNLNEWLK